MNTITAVAKELLEFTFIDWFGFRSGAYGTQSFSGFAPASTANLTEFQRQSKIYQSVATDIEPSVVYVSVPRTNVYAFPTITFDGAFQELTYGTAVQSVAIVGRFVEVMYGDRAGWILRDDVRESLTDVLPKLSSDVLYDSTHSDVVKIRAVISDAFLGGALSEALHDIEYVLFELHKKGKHITWPQERPRVSGSWQRILKGVPRVHIGVAPKVNAVMETVDESGDGHVAYVHDVSEDESILISEVGYEHHGFYTQRTLTKNMWKESRPIFIEVA